MTGPDRVGLGWRGELAAGIFEHLSALDVLEVIAEDGWHTGRREAAALADLARARPLMLHGVTLGLASCSPVAGWRLDRMARLVERVQPEAWSEHLAFVRAGGVEIGHLAAPPRCAATVEGAVANVSRAARVVGAAPLLENIATLIDPPGSTLDEPAWVGQVLRGAGAGALLDLHNLHANALNFGHDPVRMLHRLPLERVAVVHVAGGGWIEHAGVAPRWLDDHVHAVPEAVFVLLQALAAAVQQPLTVVLERDGRYPAFGTLLAELQQARDALARGRAQQAGPTLVAQRRAA
ncbi:MAG: hypothetical protein RJA10_482 [Pseudomonadota bacterium]|jgi:uncharacterized protein (UPF0276 family)